MWMQECDVGFIPNMCFKMTYMNVIHQQYLNKGLISLLSVLHSVIREVNNAMIPNK